MELPDAQCCSDGWSLWIQGLGHRNKSVYVLRVTIIWIEGGVVDLLGGESALHLMGLLSYPVMRAESFNRH